MNGISSLGHIGIACATALLLLQNNAVTAVASVQPVVADVATTGVTSKPTSIRATTAGVADIHLDANPTPESSVLFTFDSGGPTLLLPRVFFTPSRIPLDPKQAIDGKAVEFAFWYPDMTPSDWNSTMDKYMDKQRGTYVPEKDRFRVHVEWMFYSNPDWDDLSPDKRPPMYGLDPRPPRIELNLHCYRKTDGHCIFEMQRFDSGIPGLDGELSKEFVRKHPEAIENAKKHPESGLYLSKPDAPYELFLDCRTIECQGFVYDKASKMQYRMVFATEALSHTDALISAIDKMVAKWSAAH